VHDQRNIATRMSGCSTHPDAKARICSRCNHLQIPNCNVSKSPKPRSWIEYHTKKDAFSKDAKPYYVSTEKKSQQSTAQVLRRRPPKQEAGNRNRFLAGRYLLLISLQHPCHTAPFENATDGECDLPRSLRGISVPQVQVSGISHLPKVEPQILNGEDSKSDYPKGKAQGPSLFKAAAYAAGA
jgi:hypothetical protein